MIYGSSQRRFGLSYGEKEHIDLKRILSFAVSIVLCLGALAESYQITDVQYDLDGRTKPYALNKALDIRTDTVFNSKEELNLYIDFITQKVNDQRVLENSQVSYQVGLPNEQGIAPVTLFIAADETWNILPLPYPKYNSNSGFSLKLKVKDYNFLGSMQPLNFDLEFYQEDEGTTNVLGLGFDFSIPFAIGPADAQWSNDISADYKFGDTRPSFSFSTGLDLSYAFKYVVLQLEADQAFDIDPDYREAGDEFYAKEYLKLSAPVTLLRTTSLLGNLVFAPHVSLTYYWDADGINHEDLIGPSVGLGYALTIGQVNWYGNFRKGITTSFTHSYEYNFESTDWTTALALEFQGFYFINAVGLTTRSKIFTHYDPIQGKNTTTTNVANWLRGVYDSSDYNEGRADMSSGFVLNLDFPIKIVQTDWLGWGKALFKRSMPSWFGIFDFELQLAPFIDIALYGADDYCLFHLDDGFYAAGLEVIVYPTKMRSIQVRASAGMDLGAKLLKHDWRSKRGLEIEFGIGLHY